MMQQHRQLSGRGHDGPLLGVPPTTLGQFQFPASTIAVNAERSQNMLRSLHQQRAQIRGALFTDVQLRLALSRVPASRLQSQIAAHVAALAEALRIFQRQQPLRIAASCTGTLFLPRGGSPWQMLQQSAYREDDREERSHAERE